MSAFVSEGVALSIGAWVGTYLVHSTVLFALVYGATRAIRNTRVREQLWRAALFGPLLTASLQVGAGLSPLGGTWSVGQQAASADVREVSLNVAVPTAAEVALLLDSQARAGSMQPPAAVRAGVAPTPVPLARRVWSLLGFGAIGLGVFALTLRALLEAVRMGRLGRRSPLAKGALHRELERLGDRVPLARRVRLETTPSGVSPYATGVLFPRIVIPAVTLERFDARAQRAMLAHELGHVVRFDPAWFAAIRSISSLFFFQPLNWITVAKLDETAEFACDEFAVRLTGDEVGLARCLTSVAEWIVGSPPTAAAACPMAHKRSKLSARVERILDVRNETRGTALLSRALGIGTIALTATLVPGIAAAEIAPEEPHLTLAVRHVTSDTPDPIEALFLDIASTAAQLEDEAGQLLAAEGASTLDGAMLERIEAFRLRAVGVRRFARSIIQLRALKAAEIAAIRKSSESTSPTTSTSPRRETSARNATTSTGR